MPKTATDKATTNGKTYLIPELDLTVSVAWLRLISWCQRNIPHGQICYKIERGEPTELVSEHTKRKVRFDKEDILPESTDKI